jgi:undecaprenyl-diphosphatase
LLLRECLGTLAIWGHCRFMDDIDTRPPGLPKAQFRKNAWILALVLLIASLASGFLELASEVGEGESRSIDRAILLALRVPGHPGTPRGPAGLREIIKDLSSLGSPTVLCLVVLLACGYLATRGRPKLAAVVLAFVGSGFLAASLFKAWFDRARPEVVPHLVPVYTLSFPSGHAADSAIVYLTLAMLVAATERRRPTRIFLLASAIALILTIGFTRIYLGVHWPSDVLAGWIFGLGLALAGHLGIKFFRIGS